jgi:hypothetical protein
MEESSTYQYLVAKGMAKGELQGAKKLLLRQGTIRFGTPDARIAAALDAISDLEQLEKMGLRLLDVSSWDELLAPQPTAIRSANAPCTDTSRMLP